MWPVAGFPIPFIEYHRKTSHCRGCGRSRWVPFHHPVLLRKAIKLVKLKPFANSRGGFQRAPDSFPFMIIIKRLGDARGSAISQTSPWSFPKGGPLWDQKSFPSMEPMTFPSATELVSPFQLHRRDEWFNLQLLNSDLGSPPSCHLPLAWPRGFVVNGAGRVAVSFPLTGCVYSDPLLHQLPRLNLSFARVECSPTRLYQCQPLNL